MLLHQRHDMKKLSDLKYIVRKDVPNTKVLVQVNFRKWFECLKWAGDIDCCRNPELAQYPLPWLCLCSALDSGTLKLPRCYLTQGGIPSHRTRFSVQTYPVRGVYHCEYGWIYLYRSSRPKRSDYSQSHSSDSLRWCLVGNRHYQTRGCHRVPFHWWMDWEFQSQTAPLGLRK